MTTVIMTFTLYAVGLIEDSANPAGWSRWSAVEGTRNGEPAKIDGHKPINIRHFLYSYWPMIRHAAMSYIL